MNVGHGSLILLSFLLTPPVHADVKSATDAGFEVSRTTTINASPAQV